MLFEMCNRRYSFCCQQYTMNVVRNKQEGAGYSGNHIGRRPVVVTPVLLVIMRLPQDVDTGTRNTCASSSSSTDSDGSRASNRRGLSKSRSDWMRSRAGPSLQHHFVVAFRCCRRRGLASGLPDERPEGSARFG